MKLLHLQWIIISLLLVQKSTAQDTSATQPIPLNQHPVEKPALFAQLPNKFSCSPATIINLFSVKLNGLHTDLLSADLAEGFHIEGIVLTRVAISPQQYNINIRCTNYQNALLNICRITLADGTVKYTGRLVHPDYGDLLQLQEENGQYSFIKQKKLLTMVE